MLVGMLPISVLEVGAESGGKNAVGAPRGAAQVSAAAYNTTVKGISASYTISGVTPGTYTMKVSKKKHVTRQYTVTVTSGTKTQNAQIHLMGDVNGNGKISTADVNKINSHAKKVNLLW